FAAFVERNVDFDKEAAKVLDGIGPSINIARTTLGQSTVSPLQSGVEPELSNNNRAKIIDTKADLSSLAHIPALKPASAPAWLVGLADGASASLSTALTAIEKVAYANSNSISPWHPLSQPSKLPRQASLVSSFSCYLSPRPRLGSADFNIVLSSSREEAVLTNAALYSASPVAEHTVHIFDGAYAAREVAPLALPADALNKRPPHLPAPQLTSLMLSTPVDWDTSTTSDPHRPKSFSSCPTRTASHRQLDPDVLHTTTPSQLYNPRD
ncbi:hypothetical protein CF327_g7720, partial [Tilletia walkeri]